MKSHDEARHSKYEAAPPLLDIALGILLANLAIYISYVVPDFCNNVAPRR